MTDLVVGRDDDSIPTWVISFPETAENFGATLSASVEKTLVVPADKRIALFSWSGGTNIWIAESDIAISLPGSSFVARSSELNPIGRLVTAGETLRFISDEIIFINVTFYRR